MKLGLLLLLVAATAGAEEIHVTALPAERGAIVEARTIIEAPAEQIAAQAADPAAFIETFPAERSEVVGREGDAALVAVSMRHGWPVGLVEWVESVRRSSDGAAHLVVRRARPGGFYKLMEATWRVVPASAGRCEVTYRVAMDLNRWSPQWMLRRGMLKGVRFTVEALRRRVARGMVSAHSHPEEHR